MKQKYIPAPVDTSEIKLSDDILNLSQELAKNVHEVWAAGRIADGWEYGEVRDDDKRETPCLVPFEKLSKEEIEYDINTAISTLKFIISKGFVITKK